MTQTGVAERLAQLIGHLLSQASTSAMERGFDGDSRRRFDTHELYLLSVVFDVPIAYFFIPPPAMTGIELADTRRPVAELYRTLLGTDAQLDEQGIHARVVQERLGHSTSAITVGTYSHVAPTLHDEAAEQGGRLIL